MRVIELKSGNDAGAEVFFHLTDAQMRSRQEPEKGIFIAEGPKVVRTALETGNEPLAVLIRRRHLEDAEAIFSGYRELPVYTADDDLLSEITGFRLQRSWVLCAFRRPQPKTVMDILSGKQRIAVLEGITEPSNVGAIFRSAAALGADGILLSDNCSDPYHRRAVRVCMGALFTVPFASASVDEIFELLGREGFYSIGMCLRENSRDLDDPEIMSRERLAFFLGNEDTGLSDHVIENCDSLVKIPMAPGIDSLNVAATAAIVFWQFRRKPD